MGLVKWVALLTCGHVVGGDTVVLPHTGQPYWCGREGCHSTTVAELVSDIPERDSQGRV